VFVYLYFNEIKSVGSLINIQSCHITKKDKIPLEKFHIIKKNISIYDTIYSIVKQHKAATSIKQEVCHLLS
jgi:hypothetical protein